MTDMNPEDEQMLLVVHKHWVSLFGDAVLTLVPGFVILWLLFLFRDLPLSQADASVHAIVTFLVPLSFLILWTILAIQWTNYYLDMLVVTDRRVFYTAQINFTQRSVRQWYISDVRRVNVRFRNIFESYFNYGSLEISVHEEQEPVNIAGIPDPEYIAAVILKQDDRYGELKETARKQRELLHFLSHEVKGHLAKSKAAFASIVEGDFGSIPAPLDTMAHRALADSQQGVETVMSILDNSDLSRGGMRFEKKRFDLSATVRRAVETFRSRIEGKGLALTTFIDPLCMIEGDEEKIRQHVLRNFLENALRYTPAGHIEISLSCTENAARLCVADTGVGIVANDIDKLFKQGGHGTHSKEINPESTGYGLFVAKQVVDGHGGRIWARSSGPGSGSHFFAEFPLA
ncbi:MAG: HAMP domain-containing sensor histidine kinase [Patescibacteria group bacterium]|mgnify:CR=1 FL=1